MAAKMAFFKIFACFGSKQKKEKHESPVGTPEETTKRRVRYVVDVELYKVERCDFSTRDEEKILFTKRNKDTEVQKSPFKLGPPENQDFVNEGDLTLEEL